jgi:transcription antitermination factor NusG
VAVAHLLIGLKEPRSDMQTQDLQGYNSQSGQNGLHWYALQVNCRKEANIAAQIEGRGVECFLPQYKSLRKWSDRTKEIRQALFPGYLFCRFNYESRQPVVTAAGVIQVVGNGRHAVAVPDSEIEALQVAIASGVPSQPWPYLRAGELVRVNYGHLSGLQGILINFKGNHRVVLSVTLLQRSLALEVDLSWLTPVERAKHPERAVLLGAANTATSSI